MTSGSSPTGSPPRNQHPSQSPLVTNKEAVPSGGEKAGTQTSSKQGPPQSCTNAKSEARNKVETKSHSEQELEISDNKRAGEQLQVRHEHTNNNNANQ